MRLDGGSAGTELAEIERALAELNLNDSNAILFFGTSAQTEVTEVADEMLEGVHNKDTGPAGQALNEMVSTLRGFSLKGLDPNQTRGLLARLFGGARPVAKILQRYEEVRARLEDDPRHPDAPALFTRHANAEGEGEITTRQLVELTRRLNPDRVVVPQPVACGECALCRRGSETLCPVFRENLLSPGGFSDRVLVRERAVREKLTLVADVRLWDRPLFFCAMPGTTGDNLNWVRRKANLVQRMLKSTYRVVLNQVAAEQQGYVTVDCPACADLLLLDELLDP